MFKIKKLEGSINNKKIIKDFNIELNPGELHVIMGPNGSGKSTLTHTIAGKENYVIEKGDITLDNKSIIDLDPEERAGKGIFVSFQYPISLPGVNNIYFLKEAVNSVRKYRGDKEISSVEFMKKIKSKIKDVDFDESFINRAVNDGFSGGEKKRNEILQLLMLEPKVAILDETDSGLDIDAFDPARLVLFPEMALTVDVPEITVHCWDILGVKPESIMCASSRMVVKKKGAHTATVVPCSLLPYDREFEMGANLADSVKAVQLNHPNCAKFCVLGGASCTSS